MGWLKRLLRGGDEPAPGQRTEQDLNEIAGRGMSAIGLYSWRSVYDAYKEAGLSDEEAKAETDARVIIIG